MSLKSFFTASLFLLAAGTHAHQDYYYSSWSFLLLAVTIWCCSSMVAPVFGKFVAALMFYFTLSVTYMVVWRMNRYFYIPPYEQAVLRLFSADSMVKFSLITIPVMIWVAKERDRARELGSMFASLACVAFSLAAIVQLFKAGHCTARNSCGGWLGNPSMNAAFVVCLLPFTRELNKSMRVCIFMIACAAVAVSKSSVGVGMLAVYLVMWMWYTNRKKFLWLAPIPVLVGYMSQGMSIFSSSGRIAMLKYFIGLWSNNPGNLPFGMGVGTFSPIAKNMQVYMPSKDSEMQNFWNWMHNDFAEFLFVGGAVGLTLMVAVYLLSVWRSRFDKPLFCSVVLFGIFMLLDYPLHLPATCILGAWLFSLATCRIGKTLTKYF